MYTVWLRTDVTLDSRFVILYDMICWETEMLVFKKV